MEGGHRIFSAGVALLLMGFLVAVPAIFVLNLGLAYAGGGVSLLGFILFILGIHVFMGQTIVEVRDILGLPGPKQTPADTPAPSEHAAPTRLGVGERILIIIIVVSLLLTFLLFFVR